jgi:hypothetical protein
MKIKAPVTVHDGTRYVAPGTEIDLPEDEAKRLIEVHGEYGGANRPQDPANTQTLNVIDRRRRSTSAPTPSPAMPRGRRSAIRCRPTPSSSR